MFRKLLLLAALTAAGLGVSASSASAVTIENPGENEFFGANTLSLHSIIPSTPPVEFTALKCIEHWRGSVSSTGHISLPDIDIDPGVGTVGPCAAADDCNGAGWEGQIEETHEGTPWEFSAHLTICIAGQGGPLDGVPYTIECEINDSELHCGGTHDGLHDQPEEESFVRFFQIGMAFLPFFVEGEMAISNPLGLMHD